MSQGEESASNEVKTLSLEPDMWRMETNMGRGSSSSLSGPNSSWFTPKRLLVLFSVINLINYVDRGAIASNGVNGTARTCNVTCADGRTMQVAVGRHSTNGTNMICAPSSTASNETCTTGSGIQGAFNLNNFEEGVLSSAFMVGLLVASPTFAHLAKSVNPFRLIGVGLSVWTLAVIGCGLSFNFWSITIFRMLVGVGEASFISLAAPFIDDNAPANKKTAWLGIFYMCISVGYAIGYIYGGLVGNHFSWRCAFFGEAILMFPFAVLGFFIKPLQLKGFTHAESKKALTSIEIAAVVEEGETLSLKAETGAVKEEPDSKSSSMSKCATRGLNQFSSFLKDIKVLLLEKVYVVNVLGYIAYNFVIGAYSYWGPKAGKSIYNMSNADYIFGGVTIVSGVLGTLAGGYALDRLTSTIPNAFKLLCTSTFFGAVFCFSAFCFKSMYVFLVLFTIGEVLVFATQGPVNFTSLHCVKPSLRPLSMAMSTVAIHIFGDVPSSPLVGFLQDYVNKWRETALILTSIFFLAAGIWFIGIFLRGVDRLDEESEHPAAAAERANTTPLLEEKATERTEAPALP